MQYAEHPLIAFIRQIRNDYGIGYNAVSSSADWLMIEKDTVKLQLGYDAAHIAKADSRWTEPVFRRYLKLLNDFYHDTQFQQFYDGQSNLYRQAEGVLDSLLVRVDVDWLNHFYGKDLGYQGSYVNYYITNDKVLVPNYNDPNDANANAIVQTLYPNRKVVGIDVRNLYANGGMVHCVTQQQPI